MTADPERPIEVRDVHPEVLLHFRSTSDIVRYQPDPYHLKQLVTDLKNFQARASRDAVPDGFIRLVVQAFVDGFRRLDALPREHPFWDQTNRRPTLGSLREFCDHLLRDNPCDGSALRTAMAIQILTLQNFDPEYWVQLHALGQLHVSWPIYTAVLSTGGGKFESGTDDFQSRNLLWFLKVTGLCNEAVATLGELMRSQDRSLSQWAKSIVDGCGERSEILDKARLVHEGMRRQEVLQLLGEPSCSPGGRPKSFDSLGILFPQSYDRWEDGPDWLRVRYDANTEIVVCIEVKYFPQHL